MVALKKYTGRVRLSKQLLRPYLSGSWVAFEETTEPSIAVESTLSSRMPKSKSYPSHLKYQRRAGLSYAQGRHDRAESRDGTWENEPTSPQKESLTLPTIPEASKPYITSDRTTDGRPDASFRDPSMKTLTPTQVASIELNR